MLTSRLVCLLPLLISPLPLGGSGAQENADSPATETSAEEAAAPPTISDVAILARQHHATILALQSRLAPDQRLRDIVSDFERASATRREPETWVADALEKHASIYQLRLLRWEADLFRLRLEEWDAKLDALFDEASRDLEAVVAGRQAVEQAVERVPDLPAAVVSEIESLRARAAAIEPALSARFDAIVEVQGRVDQEKIAIVASIAQLDAAIEQNARSALERDAPRLWQAWSARSEGAESPARRMAGELRRYATERRSLLVVHVLFIVALAVLFTALRRGARRGKLVDAGLSDAAGALENPLSAALVLGLLPAYWIHSLGPRGLVLACYLGASVPLLRLLGKHLPTALRFASRTLVASVILFLVVELVTGLFSLPYRLGLLAITAVGGVAFVTAQRPAVSAGIESPRLRAVLVLVARLGSAALAGAVLANVLGYVRMADLLTRATLFSAYAGLLTFLGAVVLCAFGDLSVRSRPLQSLRMVRNRTAFLAQRIKKLVNVTAVLFWVLTVLLLTRLFEPLRDLSSQLLTHPLRIGALQLDLGDIVVFGVTLWAAILLARLVRFTLEEGMLPALPLARGVPAMVSKLTGYAIVTIGFTVALGAAGFPVERLTFLAGAFALGLGFGLQNLISNFVSGLILLFERPIQVGDTIEFGTRQGKVTRIGIRSSVVRTFDGAEISVPNASLIANEVVNWTLSDQLRRVVVRVGVAYSTDPKRVPGILLPAAAENEAILREPAPEVVFLGFGESSLDFELRCWTDSPDWLRHKSDITFALYERLKEAGVEIPFPQRDIHVRTADAAPSSTGPRSTGPR
jgi:small-conductance mechanosensitive channel